MSQFLTYVNNHCLQFNVGFLDKLLIVAHWPLYKIIWYAEFGKNKLFQNIANSLIPILERYQFTYSIPLESYSVKIPVRFSVADLANYEEIFWANAYSSTLLDSKSIKTIVDLGANTGMTTLYFLAKFPNLETVLLVEANPNLIKTLQENLAPFNKIRKIFIEEVCVGDQNNEYEIFYISSQCHRLSSTDSQHLNAIPATPIKVKKNSLTQLIDKHLLPQTIDILKMDIEGSEYEILSNAPEVFKRFRYIYAEVHGETQNRQSFIASIASLGFTTQKYESAEGYQTTFMFASRNY